MKSATISELKDQLSKFLRFVKQGEVVTVLERGIPIAEIQPRKRKALGVEDSLHDLEAKGIIRRGDPKKLLKFPFPIKGDTTSHKTGAVEALLKERRRGR